MVVEDDPVIKEIPVFLSKQLSKSLYLLQYPLHTTSIPYDTVEHTKVNDQYLFFINVNITFS